jgi:RNA polymerase subunit RPABC4/transcription elongation factor Spt4
MTTEICPVCRTRLYEWKLPHTCPPRWEAIRNGYHDEEEPVEFFSDGYDEERVAESFAAYIHSDCDYPHEMEIWVRKDFDDEWKKFTVIVEMVPSFTATALCASSI